MAGPERGGAQGGAHGRGSAPAGRRSEGGAPESEAGAAEGHQTGFRFFAGRLREPIQGQEQRLGIGQEGRGVGGEKGERPGAEMEGFGCATRQTPRVTQLRESSALTWAYPLAIDSGLD